MRSDEITPEVVISVIDLVTEIEATKYFPHKRKRFAEVVSSMPEPSVWVLTLCCWQCLFNTRFKPVDQSKYYSVPVSETNMSSFKGFVDILREYDRKRITARNEGPLIIFLSSCDQQHKDFYLSLLDRKMTASFPLVEIQELLDPASFCADEVYGTVTFLGAGLSELSYPVAVSSLSRADLPLCSMSKEPTLTKSYFVRGGKLKLAGTKLLQDDLKLTSTPRFTLVGYSDHSQKRSVFHPIDYFSSLAAYRRYLEGGARASYQLRVSDLSSFMDNNLLTQVYPTTVGYAASESELIEAVKKVMQHTPDKYLCFSDEQSARTGQTFAAPVSKAFGVIEDLWVEDGEAKGFLVWFNGELQPVLFSFSGIYYSFLHNKTMVLKKQIDFWYLRLGEHRIRVGFDVRLHDHTWRSQPLKGTDISIEKCVFCGSTEYPHESGGMCKVCERRFYTYWNKYGTDVWIGAGYRVARRRTETAWEPSLLNNVKLRFKGTYVVAQDSGAWCFKSHPEAQAAFEQMQKIYKKE